MTLYQKGFSLIELMVVLAIIVVVGIISTPNIVTGVPKYRVRAAATDLAAKMRKARSTAIKEHRRITLVFDTANNKYSVDGRFLPKGESISDYYGSGVRYGGGKATQSVPGGTIPSDAVSFSANTVNFNFQGISNNQGYVYLTNNRGDAYAVGVRNTAGAIVVKRWTGSAWYP